MMKSFAGRLLTTTCLTAVVLATVSVPRSIAQAAGPDEAKWRPHGQVGARTARDHGSAGVGLFVPLGQDENSLVFIDLGINGEFDDAFYGSFALGARQLITPDLILGGYIALDHTRTEAGKGHTAVSVGVEAIGQTLEGRISLQVPITGAEGLSSATVIGSDPATLTLLDHRLVETLVASDIRSDEVPMTGVEGEIGVRLPLDLSGLDDSLRAFAGGYHYSGEGVDDLTGVSGRLEYRIRDVLGEGIPGAELFLSAGATYDDRDGANFLGEVRLRVPLGATAPDDTRHRLTALEERMTDPIVRTSRIETDTRRTVTETTVVSDAEVVDPRTGEAYDSIFFADGADTLGEGTRDDPTTLADAAARAGVGGIVVAEGNAGAIDSAVTLLDDQALLGGGTSIPVRLGDGTITSFVLGSTSPLIVGPPAANVVALARDNRLQSLSLDGGLAGIAGTDFGTLTIQSVSIANSTGDGVALVDTVGDGQVAIAGLSVTGTGGAGLSITGVSGSTMVTALSGFAVSGTGGGGALFDGVVFDADPLAAGFQRVLAGNAAIGTGPGGAVAGDGLRLDDVAGDIAFGALDIVNTGGTGLFIRDAGGKAGSFAFGNAGGSVSTSGGSALDVDPVAMASEFSSLVSAGGGIVIDTVTAQATGQPALTVGDVTVTDAAGTGIAISNVTGGIVFGTTNVTNAGGTAIALTGNDGDLAFGDVTIVNPGVNGIDIEGENGAVTFGHVDITGLGGGIGLDLTDGAGPLPPTRVELTFATLDIAGTGVGGSKGIDYSGTTNPFDVITVESGVIAGVALGIDLTGAASSGLFQYGDGSGTDADGRASTIDAVQPLVLTGLDGTTGIYDLEDVAFVGDISNLQGLSVFYVDADGGNDPGLTDGTAQDPGTLAQAIASGADVIALVDNQVSGQDVIDAAAAIQGSPNSLTLGDGQRLVSFLAEDVIDLGGGSGVPNNVLLTGIAGNQAANPNPGSGAPLLTTTGGGSDTIVLGNANLIRGVDAGNYAGASAVFGSGIAGLIVRDSMIDSLSLVGAGGTAGLIDTTFGMLEISGGGISVTGMDADFANALNRATISISGGHTGSLSFDDTSSISATGGSGLRFDDADGTYGFVGTTVLDGTGVGILTGSSGTFTFDDLTISGSTFEIDASAPTVAVTGSIASGFGTAVEITGMSGGSTAFDATIGGAVYIGAMTDGSVSFGAPVVVNSSGGPGVTLANSGGTVEFTDTVTVTGTGGGVRSQNTGGVTRFADVDVSLTGGFWAGIDISANSGNARYEFGGQVSIDTSAASAGGVVVWASAPGGDSPEVAFLGGLSILSGANTGFQASHSGVIEVADVGIRNISTTTGEILRWQGITIGALGATFDTLSASGTVSNRALTFSAVDGGTFDGGDVTIAGTGASDGIFIGSSSADFAFSSATIDGAAGAGIALSGANGDVSFGTVDIDGAGGVGLSIANNTNAVTVAGGTIGAGATNHGAVAVDRGTGAVSIGADLTNDSDIGIRVNDRTGGAVTFSGTLGHSGAGLGVDLSANSDGSIAFTGALAISGTGGGISATNSGGATSFADVDIVQTGAGQGIRIGGGVGSPAYAFGGQVSVDTSGGTGAGVVVSGAGPQDVSFLGGLSILSGSDFGFIANKATIEVADAGTNSIATMTGQVLGLYDVTIGAVGIAFDTLSASGTVAGNAVQMFNVGGGAFDGGDVTVAGTSAGAGILVANSSAAVTFSSLSISDTAEDGISLSGNSGSVSVAGATTIANPGLAGIDIEGTNGQITFGDVDITGLMASGVGLDLNGATLTDTVSLHSLDVAGAGGTPPADSIGIDLRGVTGGQTVKIGVSPAPNPGTDTPSIIQNVATGLFLDAASDANFTLGDGEDAVDQASRLLATTPIDASSAPTQGSYNVLDVNFLGASPGAGFGNTTAFFFTENGTGTGASPTDPGSVADAEASGAGLLVPVGATTIDLDVDGGGTLDLDDGQGVAAFDGPGGTIRLLYTGPSTILVSAVDRLVSDTAGNGSPALSNAGAAPVVSLGGGNRLSLLRVDGSGGAGIAASGVANIVLDNVSIANTAGEGLDFAGLSDALVVEGGLTVAGTGGAGVSIAGSTSGGMFFFPISIDNAATAGGGVALAGNTGSFEFVGGLDIDTGPGAGFSMTGGGILTVASGPNTILTGTGQALHFDGIAIGSSGVSFDSIGTGIVAAADALSFNAVTGFSFQAGSVTVAGTSGAGAGISIAGSDASFSFGMTAIGATVGAGISLGAGDGTVAFSGQTTITNPGSAGVDVQGAHAGAISFENLDIALETDGTTGLRLAGAILDGGFTATDFDLTSTSATGTVGIDLAGTTGAGAVAVGDPDAGGESATIGGAGGNTLGPATGVLFSAATLLDFTFGDGEGATDAGSSITAVRPIDATDTLPTSGSHDFDDVVFTGDVSNIEVTTVYFVDQSGAGNGTLASPGSIAGAEASTANVIVLIDTNIDNATDAIDMAGGTLDLDDGQIVISFAGGDTAIDTADYSVARPGAPGSFTFTTLNMTTIVQTPTGIDTVRPTLLTNNATTAIALPTADLGAAGIFSGAERVLVQNVGAGDGFALDATGATNVLLRRNHVTAGVQAVDIGTTGAGANALTVGIDGNVFASTSGAATPTVELSGQNISATESSIGVRSFADNIVGGTGGGVLFANVDFDGDGNGAQASGGALTIGSSGARISGAGLSFVRPTGDLGFATLDIFNQTGTGLSVDTKTGGPTTFGLATAGGNIDTTGGTAVFLDPLTVAMLLDSVTATGGANGILLDEVSGSFEVTGAVTVSNTTGAGIAIVDSPGSFTFASATVDNAGGAGIDLSGGNGAVTFGTVDIDGAGGAGIRVSGATSTVDINGGTVGTTAVAAGPGVVVENSQAGSEVTFRFLDVTANGADAYRLTNDAGLVTAIFGTAMQTGLGDGLEITGGSGDVCFGADIVHSGSGAGDSAVRISGTSGDIQICGDQVTKTNGGRAVEITGVTGGSITFDAAVNADSGAGGIAIANNTGGSTAFDGAVTLSTGGFDGVTLTNDAGHPVSFGGKLSIETTSGSGFVATGGGTVGVAATAADQSIVTGTGQAIRLDGVGLAAGGMSFDTISTGTVASGAALDFATVTGGAFSGGDVTVGGTTGAAAGISIVSSPASFAFASAAIDGAGGAGIALSGANGAATFDAVDIGGSGGAGISIAGNTNGVTVSSGSIGVSSSNAGAAVVNGGSADVTVGADTANGTGTGLSVMNRTAGTVTFSGTHAQSGTGPGVNLANSGGTVAFGGTLTLDGSGGGIVSTNTGTAIANFAAVNATQTGANEGIDIAAASGSADYNFNGQVTIDASGGTGTGVALLASGAATPSVSFLGGLSVNSGANAGFDSTGSVVLEVADAGTEQISTTTGDALSLDGAAIGGGGVHFDSLATSGAATGIALSNVSSGGGAIGFGTVNIAGATVAGVDITGTLGAALSFADLNIGLNGGAAVGFNLNGATLGAAVTADDFDVTNASGLGTTIGVDLAGIQGNQTVRLGSLVPAGGPSSSISGVQTGIVIDDTSSVQFIYGDGESAEDVASTIAAVTRISAPGTFAPGASFNFLDLTLDGSPGTGFGIASIYFVDSDGATGGGDGSGRDAANPMTLAAAESQAGAGDIIVLVNNGSAITAAGTNADDTLLLSDGGQLRGFGNGAISIGFTAPSAVQLSGTAITLADPGGGAATLTSGAGDDVVSLGASGNLIDGFILDGNPAGAARGIVDNGGATATTISHMTIRNFVTRGVEITPSTNTTISDTIFANNASDVLVNAAGTSITDVTSTGATGAGAAGAAFQIVNATGTTSLTNLSVTGAAGGGLAFTNAAGTVTATNVDLGGADALSIAGGDANFDFDATSSVANTAGTAVTIAGRTGGSFTHHGAVASNGVGAAGISIAGATVANAISFTGLVDLGTGTALGGAGVAIDNNGTASTVSFADLDIVTNGATGFGATGGGTANVATGTAGATGAIALSLDDVAAGIAFTSTSSTGGARNVFISDTTGTVSLGTGALSGATATNFDVSGGSAVVSYGGSIGNAASGVRLVSVVDTTGGSVTFDSASANALNDTAGTGILIDGAAGDVSVANASLSGTRGITILGGAANNATGTYTFDTVAIATAAGAANHAFVIDGDQGTPANNDVSATIALNNVDITDPGGLVASIAGMSGGSVTFDAASSISRTDGGLGIVATSNAGGSVTFAGTTSLSTGANTAVSLSGNAGATLAFAGGLGITTTSGTGFAATGGGTISVSGAGNTIATTTGQILGWDGVSVGGSGVGFASLTASGTTTGHAVDLNDVDGAGNVFSGGAVSIAGTSGAGIQISGGSDATFNFASATIDSAVGSGIVLTGANGAVTFDTVDIDDTGDAGIHVAGNTNAVSVNGGTIGATATPTGPAVRLAAGAGDVTIASAITNSSGRAVDISGRTGGTVTFSETIDDTGTGILLNGNIGGTVDFTNTLTLNGSGGILANNTGGTTNFAVVNATPTGAGAGIDISAGSGSAAYNFNSQVTVDTTGGTGAGVTLSGAGTPTVAFNGGLSINSGANTGFAASGGSTITVAAAGTREITTTTGRILDWNGVAIGAGGVSFGSLSSIGVVAADAISLTGVGGAGSFSGGTVNIAGGTSGAGSAGIAVTNSTAAVGFGTTTIANTGGDGIALTGNSGAVTFTGVTTITNAGSAGVDISGTNAAISFESLQIALQTANTTGLDLSGAIVGSGANVTATDFDLTSTTATGTIGVDLVNTTGAGTIRLGDPSTPFADGESATIGASGVAPAIGVRFSSATDTTFIFGDGENTDTGSSIAAVRPIDDNDGDPGNSTLPTSGTYNFLDALLTGDTTNLESSITYYYVDDFDDGTNDGTRSNPGTIAGAAASAADVIVLVNNNSAVTPDTIDIASAFQGAGTTLTLDDGQALISFANGTVDLTTLGFAPGGAPSNFLLTGVTTGGATVTDPTGNGAATLTTTAAAPTVTLNGTNGITGVVIDNGASGAGIVGTNIAALRLFESEVRGGANASAVSIISNVTTELALSNLTLRSGTGAAALSIDGSAGGITTITAFDGLDVEGGAGAGSGIFVDTATFDADTSTAGLQSVSGGNSTIGTTGDRVNGNGLTLVDVSGTLDYGDLNIANDGGTGLLVDTKGAGTTFTLGTTGGTVDTTNGTAINLDPLTVAMVLDSVAASGGANGIVFDTVAGSFQVTGTTGISGTSGFGIDAVNTNTGTFDFAAVTVDNAATAGGGIRVQTGTLNVSGLANIDAQGGTGVSQSGGAATFSGGLTIDTTTGTGIATTGGTLNVTGGGNTLNSSGGSAATMSNSAANVTFASTSSGGGTNNVSLTGVTGTVGLGAGALTGATGAAFLVSGGTAATTYAGGITQASNAALVSVSGGHSGTLTFNTGTLSATNGTGLQFSDADGTYQFNGTTTLNGGDAGIDIVSGSGGTFTFGAGTTITHAAAGSAFTVDGSPVSVTYSGNITDNNGRAVDINNHDSGTVTFQTGAIASSGASAQGIRVANSNGGSVNFNGQTTLSTQGNTAVDLATNNAGGTVNFATTGAGLDITTTTATGFAATGGGTVSVTGTGNTISSGTGTALNVSNTTIGASGLTFQSIASNGAASGIILANTGASGGLTVTGTGAANSGGTIQNSIGAGISLTNTQDVSLTSIRILNATGHGIDATNLRGSGSAVINSSISGFDSGGTVTRDAIHIVNNNTNLGLFTVRGTTITGSATSNDGVFMEAQGSSNMELSVEGGSAFTNMFGDGVQVNGITGATGTVRVTVENSSFTNAAAAGNGGISMNPFGSVRFYADINGNTFNDIMRPVTNLGAVGVTTGLTVVSDITIRNNTITNLPGARGITFSGDGSAQTRLLVDNNTIDSLGSTTKYGIVANLISGSADVTVRNNRVGQNGNLYTSGNGNAGPLLLETQNGAVMNALVANNQFTANTNSIIEVVWLYAIQSSTLNATVTGNTLTDTAGSHVELGAATGAGGSAGGTVNLNMSGNILPGSGVGVISLDESAAGAINVTQTSAAALSSSNSGATIDVFGTPQFGSAPPPTPILPTLP